MVKTGNDVYTTKSRTRVILFSKYWRILGRNELADFLHIQYTYLKGLSHEKDFKNFGKNVQNLT